MKIIYENNICPSLLIGEELTDAKVLINHVKNNLFTSLDKTVPVCRFRGTYINKSKEGYEIVGWQRNVSRLQKMDVSLPTIISINLDENFIVKKIELDRSFAGSKGLLCNQRYLNENINEKLIGMKIDSDFFNNIQVEKLHCFHITEVMGGVISCLQIMNERNLDYVFEEEVLDGISDGNDLYIAGLQKFSFLDQTVNYTIKFTNALKCVKFSGNGTIACNESFDAIFYSDGKEIIKEAFFGKDEKRLCLKIKSFSLTAVNNIKQLFTSDKGNSFMCSNIFPQAFIGLFVQLISMKLYDNNYNYVLHCLNAIQRYGGVPRCIGAIDSYEDAAKHFPKYNLSYIMM